MIHKMPGPINYSKPAKRRSCSNTRNSKKSIKRKSMKGPKTRSAAVSSSVISSHSKAAGDLERLSLISCECHQSAGRRRCSASPELEGQEGKENELRTGLDMDGCGQNGIQDKRESEEMEYEETGKNIFPDDDSNQILPVEQFFGNLDSVQDFPQRASKTSSCVQKKKRRHYYAQDDSDEEEAAICSVQLDGAL